MFIYQKQYGEIEDCQIDDSSLHAVITFKTRAEAEAVSIVFIENTLQHLNTMFVTLLHLIKFNTASYSKAMDTKV